MKLTLFFIFILLAFNDAYADGFTDITAVQANGDVIVFVTESPEYVSVKHPLSAAGKFEVVEFKNEGCEYKKLHINENPILEISCPPNGRSPLSGTKYQGKYTLGDCEKEPMAIYTCVSGCGKNVPRKMTQSWWECSE